jgi:hypothetical protein
MARSLSAAALAVLGSMEIDGNAAKFDQYHQNPPFSRGQDIEHVTRAFGMLRPGGRLVSVMSSSVTFRKDRRVKYFRDWATANGTIDELPPGSFKASGTMVNAVLVTLDRE